MPIIYPFFVLKWVLFSITQFWSIGSSGMKRVGVLFGIITSFTAEILEQRKTKMLTTRFQVTFV
jgi:hypothetical protein